MFSPDERPVAMHIADHPITAMDVDPGGRPVTGCATAPAVLATTGRTPVNDVPIRLARLSGR